MKQLSSEPGPAAGGTLAAAGIAAAGTTAMPFARTGASSLDLNSQCKREHTGPSGTAASPARFSLTPPSSPKARRTPCQEFHPLIRRRHHPPHLPTSRTSPTPPHQQKQQQQQQQLDKQQQQRQGLVDRSHHELQPLLRHQSVKMNFTGSRQIGVLHNGRCNGSGQHISVDRNGHNKDITPSTNNGHGRLDAYPVTPTHKPAGNGGSGGSGNGGSGSGSGGGGGGGTTPAAATVCAVAGDGRFMGRQVQYDGGGGSSTAAALAAMVARTASGAAPWCGANGSTEALAAPNDLHTTNGNGNGNGNGLPYRSGDVALYHHAIAAPAPSALRPMGLEDGGPVTSPAEARRTGSCVVDSLFVQRTDNGPDGSATFRRNRSGIAQHAATAAALSAAAPGTRKRHRGGESWASPDSVNALRRLAVAAAAEAAAEADGDGDDDGDGNGETDIDTDVEVEAATAEGLQQWSDGTTAGRAKDATKDAQLLAVVTAAAAEVVVGVRPMGLSSDQIMKIIDPQDPNLPILTAALKVAATVSPDAVREMLQNFPPPPPPPAAAPSEPQLPLLHKLPNGEEEMERDEVRDPVASLEGTVPYLTHQDGGGGENDGGDAANRGRRRQSSSAGGGRSPLPPPGRRITTAASATPPPSLNSIPGQVPSPPPPPPPLLCPLPPSPPCIPAQQPFLRLPLPPLAEGVPPPVPRLPAQGRSPPRRLSPHGVVHLTLVPRAPAAPQPPGSTHADGTAAAAAAAAAAAGAPTLPPPQKRAPFPSPSVLQPSAAVELSPAPPPPPPPPPLSVYSPVSAAASGVQGHLPQQWHVSSNGFQALYDETYGGGAPAAAAASRRDIPCELPRFPPYCTAGPASPSESSPLPGGGVAAGGAADAVLRMHLSQLERQPLGKGAAATAAEAAPAAATAAAAGSSEHQRLLGLLARMVSQLQDAARLSTQHARHAVALLAPLVVQVQLAVAVGAAPSAIVNLTRHLSTPQLPQQPQLPQLPQLPQQQQQSFLDHPQHTHSHPNQQQYTPLQQQRQLPRWPPPPPPPPPPQQQQQQQQQLLQPVCDANTPPYEHQQLSHLTHQQLQLRHVAPISTSTLQPPQQAQPQPPQPSQQLPQPKQEQQITAMTHNQKQQRLPYIHGRMSQGPVRSIGPSAPPRPMSHRQKSREAVDYDQGSSRYGGGGGGDGGGDDGVAEAEAAVACGESRAHVLNGRANGSGSGVGVGIVRSISGDDGSGGGGGDDEDPEGLIHRTPAPTASRVMLPAARDDARNAVPSPPPPLPLPPPPPAVQPFGTCTANKVSRGNVRLHQCLMTCSAECTEGDSKKAVAAEVAAAAAATTCLTAQVAAAVALEAVRPSCEQRGLKRKFPDGDDIEVQEASGEAHWCSSGRSDPRSGYGGGGGGGGTAATTSGGGGGGAECFTQNTENGGVSRGDAAELVLPPSACANCTDAGAGGDGSIFGDLKGAAYPPTAPAAPAVPAVPAAGDGTGIDAGMTAAGDSEGDGIAAAAGVATATSLGDGAGSRGGSGDSISAAVSLGDVRGSGGGAGGGVGKLRFKIQRLRAQTPTA